MKELSRKYDALLFDLDMTLMDFKQTETQALVSMFEKFGIDKTESNIECYHRINSGCWKELEQGKIDVSDLKFKRIRLFLDELGMDTCQTEEMAKYEIGELGKGHYLMPDAEDVLKRLCPYYPIVIASNGITDVQTHRIFDGPLSPYIQKAYISEELGVAKPSKEYFDVIFEDYGKNLCMIGDNYESDIKGAINSGIDAFWITVSEMSTPDNVVKIRKLKEVLDYLLI